ncbi:MAG: hypothetical protein Crog4KO_18700 [Crocinitomicaceae bacterium]
MKKSRIALVEIGGSHDECLLTQMHAIHKHGHDLVLITTANVAERNPAFSNYLEEIVIVNAENTRKALVREVWNKLKDLKIEKVVLNTAQGKVIRDLCLKAYVHPMEFIGIIHTTRMFTESFTQKIIHRKIKKYFLLSEQLLKQVTPPKNVSIDYFYPLRFPTENRMVEKRNKVVAVIGGVEERRKDLEGFIQMIQPLRSEKIRFVFLGKSDASKPEVPGFLQRLEEEGLTEMVQTFDQFVSQEIFDATLQNVDLILPLVHPNTPSADQYFRNQISGAMTVSFGYKIPMLMHTAYQSIAEMQPASFYYDVESFSSILKNALENAESKREEMRKHLPYTTEEQERRYANFLNIT